MVFDGEHRDDRAGFGHPIALQEAAIRQLAHRDIQQRQRHRRRSVQNALERSQIVVIELRMVHQHVHHRRHEHRCIGAIPLHALHESFGIESALKHMRRAAKSCLIEVRDIRQMEHRGGMQVDIDARNRIHHHMHGVGVEIGVGEHRGFGSAGGARGVKEPGDIVGIRLDDLLQRIRLGEALREGGSTSGRRPIARKEKMPDRWTALAQHRNQRRETLIDNDRAGFGVIQRKNEVLDTPADIERHDQQSRDMAGEVRFQVFGAIEQQRGHAFAALQAARV